MRKPAPKAKPWSPPNVMTVDELLAGGGTVAVLTARLVENSQDDSRIVEFRSPLMKEPVRLYACGDILRFVVEVRSPKPKPQPPVEIRAKELTIESTHGRASRRE